MTRKTTLLTADNARNEESLICLNAKVVLRAEARVCVCGSGFMLAGGVCSGLRQLDGLWALLDVTP